MAELSEITALRQIRLDILSPGKAIARPISRKTTSVSDAAALIREGKLRERLST